jgi:hypothetical protein
MNKRSLVLVAAISTLAFACRSLSLAPATATPQILPTPTLVSTLAHYENEWVAFDYPSGLKVFEAGFADPIWYPTVDFGAGLVAGLGDERFFHFEKYFRSIRMLRRELPAGAEFTLIMEQIYAQPGVDHPEVLVEGALDLNGPIMVDGRAAVQKSYRIYSGEPAYDFRDIWVPADDHLYIVSISTEWTNPEDLAAFEAMGDDLLAGLQLK